MAKKIIFYGGCQGVDKSKLLEEGINKACTGTDSIQRGNISLIKISDSFQGYFKTEHRIENLSQILWYEADWKQGDEYVRSDLFSKIKANNNINIINNHFSVPYKGKDNYLPGLELASLEQLLINAFYKTGSRNGREFTTGTLAPCFGILLIDPEPSLIVDFYTKKYKGMDNNVLNYLSEERILRDLNQNRRWANSYWDVACHVLGQKYVYRETLYITEQNVKDGLGKYHTRIAGFLKKFNN